MEIKYVKCEFIETGIKVTIDGNYTLVWITEFRNAKVTNIISDSRGDYLLLDLKKTEFANNYIIQKMDLDDAARLRDEFIKRVKTAIISANLAISQYEHAKENKRIEDEKKKSDLAIKLKKMNKENL